MRLWCFLTTTIALGVKLHAADSHSTNTLAEAGLKKFKLSPGLKVDLFAAEPLLVNPVAFSIDTRGRFYIAESHRWATSVFDITANTPWLLDDLSFRNVNDRAAFLARTFATNFAVLTNDSELIRLVEDRDGNGRAETSSVFADGFRESVGGTAAGVLAQGTNVWFTSVPDLWRFGGEVNSRSVISNQSGARSAVSQVTAGRPVNTDSLITDLLITGLGVHIGVSGHDVHGLIRGHDGRIYFSFGDRGVCVTNREGVVLNLPDTGGVLRCEPDGRNLEIFCSGLRNPQELAFDDYGNLWTVDNDTGGPDPCRVLHLVEGGDYGWRTSYQHMRGFGPWVSEELWRGGLDGVLPPAGTVSQGPAGLAFHPGTSLTPQLNGRFVHADFPGGVWAYSVKPRGASYEIADKEKILWNCWPTDVDFGPDGALYVLDWVESWTRSGKGRIYRLTANDQVPMTKAQLEAVAETRRLLGEGMAKRGEKELLGLLGHADRRVRLEAQWELAGRDNAPVSKLVEIAKGKENTFARLHSMWSLEIIWRNNPPIEGRQARSFDFRRMSDLLVLLDDKNFRVRTRASDLLSDLLFLNADALTKQMILDPSLVVKAAGIRGQKKIFSGFGGGRNVREHISLLEEWKTQLELILRKSSTGSSIVYPERELQKASAEPGSNDPFLIHELAQFYKVNAGRFFNRGWADVDGILGSNVLARLGGLLAHRELAHDGVTNFITDHSPRLVLEAVRAINDAPIPAAYPVLAAMLEDPRFRDANWGWSALSNITPAGPFSANVRPPREQVLRRALNANFRLGEAKHAEALVRFARGVRPSSGAGTSELSGAYGQDGNSRTLNAAAPEDGRTPGHLRAEALFLLGSWEVLPAQTGDLSIKPTKDPNHGSVPSVNPEKWPGWFDRVVGLYRPLPPRPADAAHRALAPHIAALVADKDPEVAMAAMDAAVKLRLTNAAPSLLVLMRSNSTPASLRKQIPGALAALEASELGDAVKVALADSDPSIRAAALPYLGRLQSGDAVRILGKIIGATAFGVPVSDLARSPEEKEPSRAGGRRSEDDTRLAQAAFTALGKTRSSEADAILRSSLKSLLAGELPAALELDLTEAVARRTDPEIKSLLARHEAARAKDDVLGGWRSALVGGDAERGRTIFLEKVEVQCLRCHTVKGQGGIVGPKLDGIAKQRTREYLLESIVFPNRAIASGFENVTLTLKNGAEHAGLVKGEDEKEVRLESPDEGALRIVKADIVTRQRGLSAMPDGMEQYLSKREVRDLVAFLAGLK